MHLRALAFLSLSLSAQSLAALLDLHEVELLEILRDLHSISDVPNDRHLLIRPKHTSVRDFMLDKQQRIDLRF